VLASPDADGVNGRRFIAKFWMRPSAPPKPLRNAGAPMRWEGEAAIAGGRSERRRCFPAFVAGRRRRARRGERCLRAARAQAPLLKVAAATIEAQSERITPMISDFSSSAD